MNVTIIKDFSETELDNLRKYNIFRYKHMSEIISKFILKYNNEIVMSITLPINDDFGCVSVFRSDGKEATVMEMEYF